MSQPHGFSWIDKPLLAGLALPESSEDLEWLRNHGIQLLISLSEEPVRRDWINEAGLMVVHVPVQDLTAPTQEQLESCVSAIAKAHARQMGVAVHCTAGLGRTGTVLAAYLVYKGVKAQEAISQVRKLRPGSIETEEQAEAVVEFARLRNSR